MCRLRRLPLCLLAPAALGAQSPADAEKIQALERRVQELERRQQATPPTPNPAGNPQVPMVGFFEDGFLVTQSSDGRFKYWLECKMILEGAWYGGSENSYGNGVELRQARLGFKGQLYRDWVARMDIDYLDNRVDVKDMWIAWAGWPRLLVKAGNQLEPISMDNLTQSHDTWFVERSYMDAFSPERHLGLSLSHWGANWQVAAGLYGQNVSHVDTTGVDEGWGVTARASWAPILDKGRVLHLGLGASQRRPDSAVPVWVNGLNQAQSVTVESGFESHVTRAKVLTTGTIPYVDHTLNVTAEVAGSFGPLSFQAERSTLQVKRQGGLAGYAFTGWFAQVGWFLTPDHRAYVARAGEWARLRPVRPGGAWEVLARVSRLDLFDPGVAGDPLTPATPGGRGFNWTLGLTWHITPNHKLMVNQAWVDLDPRAVPTKPVYGTVPGDQFYYTQARLQIVF